MLKTGRGKKGQGISAEYVFMIALVSISLAVMVVYVRRTLQGRYRDANRMVYESAAVVLNSNVYAEYEPYYTNTASDTDSMTTAEQKIVADDVMDRSNISRRKVNSLSTQQTY